MTDPVSCTELASLPESGLGDMVKAVVDIRRGIMAIDGSLQRDLWGINLYPTEQGADMSQGNRSREVEDAETRMAIQAIVARLVTE
jgi:hypothetical protein